MKKKTLLLILFLNGVFYALAGEVSVFRSNSLGMPLEKVAEFRRNESDWILEIGKTDIGEFRRLYYRNQLEKTWEREYSGGEMVREKETGKDGREMTEIFFREGRILRIKSVSDQGITEESEYVYSGPWLRKVLHSREGEPLYRDEYVTDPEGRLIRVERIFPDQPVFTSRYGYNRGRLVREFYSQKDREELFLVDPAEKESSEIRIDGKLVSRIWWEERDGIPVKVSVFPEDETEIVDEFDRENRLIRETSVTKGVPRTEEFLWEDGMLMEKILREPGLREQVLYRYRDDRLVSEEKYRNRVLAMVIRYPGDGSRIETTYRNGEALATVTYVDDLPVSTEYGNPEGSP